MTERSVPRDEVDVASFSNTMPREYRQRHHPNAVWHHARISAHRSSPVNVGTFAPSGLTTGLPLCVVADDRPALLAKICLGLEALGLDVRDAEAYIRRRLDGKVEAVDLVWIRRGTRKPQDDYLSTRAIAEIRSVLNVVVERQLDAGELLARITRPPQQIGHTRINWVMGDNVLERQTVCCANRFRGNRQTRAPHQRADRRPFEGIGGPSLVAGSPIPSILAVGKLTGALVGVDVETQDRPGLLLALAAALSHERLNIVRSVVKTVGKRAIDRFYFCELDGTGVSGARREHIRTRLLSVIGHPNVELGRDAMFA